MSALQSAGWPLERSGEALAALGRHAGVEVPASAVGSPPDGLGSDEDLTRWLASLAEAQGLETEAMETWVGGVADMTRHLAPGLIRLGENERSVLLAVVGSRRRALRVLDPGGEVRSVSIDEVRTLLTGPAKDRVREEVESFLTAVELPEKRRPRVREALLRQRLRGERIGGCWTVAAGPGAPLGVHARAARLPSKLMLALGSHGVQHGLWIASWWLLGSMVLQNRAEPGWIAAWALALLSTIPFRYLTARTSGDLAVDLGRVLKRSLLAGALAVDPHRLQKLGTGQLFGRAVEAGVLETVVVRGGFAGLTAGVELAFALTVLTLGAGGLFHAALLVAWVALMVGLARRFHRRLDRWTTSRLDLTHALVEQLVGHRTRAVQEAPERWHLEGDLELRAYAGASRRMDRVAVALEKLLSRGWLLLGLLGLAPAFVAGDAAGPLAVGLGGVLLAYQALGRMAAGLVNLAAAEIAWRQVGFFHRAEEAAGGRAAAAVPTAPASGGGPVLAARGVGFRHPGQRRPALRDVDLTLSRGDKVLLEGPSGSGKSTLGAVLSAARKQESGLLFLDGLDLHSVGSRRWRERVVFVPQFHQNHVLTASFGFNLLMGRGWPPDARSSGEARDVCGALGLGHLLRRMPAGMEQMVGETGWQLSHGERSRLFVARAILQKPDVMILDESFAALDPDTLRQALEVVLDQECAVVAIAHP